MSGSRWLLNGKGSTKKTTKEPKEVLSVGKSKQNADKAASRMLSTKVGRVLVATRPRPRATEK